MVERQFSFLSKAYRYVQVLIHLMCSMAFGNGLEEMLVSVCLVMWGPHECPFIAALDQTQQVRKRTLARGEVTPYCLLPELWAAAPSTACYGRTERTMDSTRRCLAFGYGQWKVEGGKDEL